MRILTWNMRRATASSDAWKILTDLNPDVALLQEVSGVPSAIHDLFDIKLQRAISKNGKPQKFGTAILVKGKIIKELPLLSEYDWVNRELSYFKGNIVPYIIEPTGFPRLHVVSVYSPAWPIHRSRYEGIDISDVKLKQNPQLWVTEILWSVLKNANLEDARWIVGGDLNSSETFDLTFSSGNREILDRMESLGFTECLRAHNGKLTPTFRNSHGAKVIHQLDHLFVTNPLYSLFKNCTVGDESVIFGRSISDHLPVIANFEDI